MFQEIITPGSTLSCSSKISTSAKKRRTCVVASSMARYTGSSVWLRSLLKRTSTTGVSALMPINANPGFVMCRVPKLVSVEARVRLAQCMMSAIRNLLAGLVLYGHLRPYVCLCLILVLSANRNSIANLGISAGN